MILQKGANTPIKNPAIIQVQLFWGTYPFLVSPVCFFLKEDGKVCQVLDEGEENSTPISGHHGDQLSQYSMNLNEVSSDIVKIVFACVLEGTRPAQEAGMVVSNEDGENVTFEWSPASNDRALLIGEIYRYKKEWKVRAIGEAVKGGRKELLQFYQSDGRETEKNSFKSAPKIVAAIDASIYAYSFYESGDLQKLFNNIFIASSTLNPLKEMDVWFYAAKHRRTAAANKDNFQTYIDDSYPKPGYFNGMGTENLESSLIMDLMEEYKDQETIIYFITNGNSLESHILDKWKFDEKANLFWEFIILDKKYENSFIPHTKNIKILPLSSLNTKNQGDLQQILLKPIQLWMKG